MKKRIKGLLMLGLCGVLTTTMFAGCGKKEPVNLNGEWKQVNSATEGSYQTATIKDGEIEIYWESDNGDTKSLYWAGTYIAPTEYSDIYKWDSENDFEKTEKSLLSSSDEKKTITYENNELSYDVTALGVTTTVRLEKQQ